MIYGVFIAAATLDPTIAQFNNRRAVSEGREAVSNDKQGEVLTESFDRLHDGRFGFIVQRTGGFIKDDDIGLFVEGVANADALALATR